MALITGTPLGVVNTMDALYVDTAPSLFFQDQNNTNPLNNPDADGFYWGLTGSATYPVYELGCYENFVLGGNMEINAIRCDTVGDKGVIQKLSYLEITFDLKTFFPLATFRHIIRGGAVTTTSGATEKMGIGQPNNNQFYRFYFPSVYDPDTGDYVLFHGHKGQFVDSWQISFGFGIQSVMGVTVRLYADTTLPAAQQFATVVRADPSAIT